jgi:hypothetical protein
MPRPANLRRTVRTLAMALLLSLALHGALLMALWFCPMHLRSAPAIADTRVAVELCVLGPASDANQGTSPPPTDALGSRGKVETSFNPIVTENPTFPPEPAHSTGPVLSPANPLGPSTIARDSPKGDGSFGGGRGITGNLFPLPVTAGSVVYVLDHSVSMGDKLEIACRELLASLRRMPPSIRFQVVVYNTYVKTLLINGHTDLLPADPAIIDQVAHELNNLRASRGTDHVAALRGGLALHPDVLFFVTDADDLPLEQVENITHYNQGTAIDTIELTRCRNPRSDSPLALLARGNHGTYRRVSFDD